LGVKIKGLAFQIENQRWLIDLGFSSKQRLSLQSGLETLT
jgi:hypothetical protein